MSDSVSVIITCYNLERYIGRAIRSVLSQDVRLSFEVLVVDDCSTDRSAEIIANFPEVRYLRTRTNCGVLMATVLGLENTSGSLVFFLDGDDVWESRKLSRMLACFSADPCLALVTHDLCFVDAKEDILARETQSHRLLSCASSTEISKLLRRGILMHSDYVWLGSAYAVRRALGQLEKFCAFVKLLPDPHNTYQDWPLAFWVACQSGTQLGYVPEKLFRYRLHSANHSGDASSIEKVLRNLTRSRNTMHAIDLIGNLFLMDRRVQRSSKERYNFYCYLINLYSGSRLTAIYGFLGSLVFLSKNLLLLGKEFIRFWGVQVLGPQLFISILARRSRDDS